jgi:hypothetical protein
VAVLTSLVIPSGCIYVNVAQKARLLDITFGLAKSPDVLSAEEEAERFYSEAPVDNN